MATGGIYGVEDFEFRTGASGIMRAAWRADPRKRGPARGVARWKSLLQALVDVGLRHLVVRSLRKCSFNTLPEFMLHAPSMFAAARTSRTTHVGHSCWSFSSTRQPEVRCYLPLVRSIRLGHLELRLQLVPTMFGYRVRERLQLRPESVLHSLSAAHELRSAYPAINGGCARALRPRQDVTTGATFDRVN
jgi:hypothetical protein